MAFFLRFLSVYFLFPTIGALLPILDGAKPGQGLGAWLGKPMDDAMVPLALSVITYVLAGLMPQKHPDQ